MSAPSSASDLRSLVRRARRRLGTVVRNRRRPVVARDGWTEGRVSTPVLDHVGDDDLDVLNGLLPWHCFTVDEQGRRFGAPAWSGKRIAPEPVPDPRILRMDERFGGLRGQRVLEVGCFEGVHTIGLARTGADVLATDGRVENVAKTAVRCAFFGVRVDVDVWDVERDRAAARLAGLAADLVHHVGVLYHLADPVSHVLDLGAVARRGLMLDTHVAADGEATSSYSVAGRTQRYKQYGEYGRADPFSGLQDHAKWLPLEDLVALLGEAGFASVDVVERRDERNGLRVLLFAER